MLSWNDVQRGKSAPEANTVATRVALVLEVLNRAPSLHGEEGREGLVRGSGYGCESLLPRQLRKIIVVMLL